jgi:hypothetical protein
MSLTPQSLQKSALATTIRLATVPARWRSGCICRQTTQCIDAILNNVDKFMLANSFELRSGFAKSQVVGVRSFAAS